MFHRLKQGVCRLTTCRKADIAGRDVVAPTAAAFGAGLDAAKAGRMEDGGAVIDEAFGGRLWLVVGEARPLVCFDDNIFGRALAGNDKIETDYGDGKCGSGRVSLSQW